jgi:hypothetical protein
MNRQTEASNEMAVDEQPGEEEDLDVSNLLVTKSERAATTESTPAIKSNKSKAALVKAVALGSIALTAAVVLGRWVISKPRRGLQD